MDFNRSDDRQMLVDSLARYLKERYTIEDRHMISGSDAGWSPQKWSELADLGMVGALFPEHAGGFGGGGFDIAAVFEQLGIALAVEPFLGTLMAGRILAERPERQDILGDVIAGTAIIAFAHEEPQSRYDLADVAARGERTEDGWVLTGAKAVVPQLEAAHQILVSARIGGVPGGNGGIGLFLVARDAPGVSVRGYPLIDGGRGGELSLNGVPADLVAEDGFDLVENAVAAGLVALSWEAIGIMDALKTATVGYLRTRTQFGKPLGAFQALQHRLATLSLEIEQARSAAINAAAALDADRFTRERAVSAAKFTIGRVGTLVAEEAIQMHGGIGMTWELPLSHYAKRLTMIGHQLGDEDHHLARYAKLAHLSP